jgi:hypothetical protein
MRIDDILYFAPGIRFDEVDLGGQQLPEQFRARIEGFYLRPAELCADKDAAFAAGALVLACIDALARIQLGSRVGERFKKFATDELSSFKSGDRAARLYYDFRNGLIHEARIKKGAQFSLQFDETIVEIDGVFVINPRRVVGEVRDALERYVEQLQKQPEKLERLTAALREDYADDMGTQPPSGPSRCHDARA